jgi:hypothetical protein
VLLRLSAFLASHRAAANLATAARAAVKLGLTKLLLAGTEWHGKPHEADLGRETNKILNSRFEKSSPLVYTKVVHSGQSKQAERSLALSSRLTQIVATHYSLAAE